MVGWFEQLLPWAGGKCCVCIAALFSLQEPGQQRKLFSLDMTMVAEDLLGAYQSSCGNVSGRPAVPAFNPQDAGIKAGPRERTAFDFE